MPLTPVAHWMTQQGEDFHRFSQSILLSLPQGVDHDGLLRTLTAVVDRHDAGRDHNPDQRDQEWGSNRNESATSSGEIAPDQHIKDEGMAGRMGAQLMAIVTEGQNGRNYYAPTPEHERIAAQAQPTWKPTGELADEPRAIWCKLYGLIEFADLFTRRQLVALTTFSDLVVEAREQVYADALAAGLPDDDVPLREGGSGARAYAEAVNVYLAMTIDKLADRNSVIASSILSVPFT